MNPADATAIRVIVAHPDPILTAGLATTLREQAGSQVYLREPQDGQGRIDVTITDFEQGLKMAAGGRDRFASRTNARVMVVARQGREHEVRLALESGVHGFLVQDCRLKEVVDGVRALALGQRYTCMTIAQCMAESISRDALTAREAEVLALLAGGHCNKAIARELGIAVGTVKAHVKGIMGKLGVSTRTQAVSVATARGLVSPAPWRIPSGQSRVPASTR